MNKKALSQPSIIALKDFRLNTQAYIDKVAKGESFVVIKRSRPAFRMEPIEDQWEAVVDFAKIKQGGVPAQDVLNAVDELLAK